MPGTHVLIPLLNVLKVKVVKAERLAIKVLSAMRFEGGGVVGIKGRAPSF